MYAMLGLVSALGAFGQIEIPNSFENVTQNRHGHPIIDDFIKRHLNDSSFSILLIKEKPSIDSLIETFKQNSNHPNDSCYVFDIRHTNGRSSFFLGYSDLYKDTIYVRSEYFTNRPFQWYFIYKNNFVLVTSDTDMLNLSLFQRTKEAKYFIIKSRKRKNAREFTYKDIEGQVFEYSNGKFQDHHVVRH